MILEFKCFSIESVTPHGQELEGYRGRHGITVKIHGNESTADYILNGLVEEYGVDRLIEALKNDTNMVQTGKVVS